MHKTKWHLSKLSSKDATAMFVYKYFYTLFKVQTNIVI